MKLAIVSDMHLGYERFADDAYRQAVEALDAAANEADAILIPGDIFDFRMPKPEVLAQAINIFRNLSKKEWKAKVTGISSGALHTHVPIIAIPGTHERRAVNVEDPVDLLNLAGLLVDISQAAATLEKDGEKVLVSGLGGVADERFKDYIKQADPKPQEGLFSIFMFHQSIYEMLPFNNDFARLDDLPKGFDLYVCGHIHNTVEMKAHGKPLLIPGSTVLTQLKDAEQDGKGFFIFDTKTGKYTFRRISSRKFYLVKIDVEKKTPDEILGLVEQSVKTVLAKNDERPIIRVVLKGRIKDGFREFDLSFKELLDRYKEQCTLEVAKEGMGKDEYVTIDETKSKVFETVSVKDYGMGVLLEKLKDGSYKGSMNPVELFELLSSDENKDKVVKKAMDNLFG